MARGQGAAGRRRPGPPLTTPVVVHDLEGARAALAADPTAVLVSAPGAAAFWGVGFLAALERELGHPLIIDCGDDAGVAMAALRAGCRDLLFTGREDVAERLASMAGKVGGRVRHELT